MPLPAFGKSGAANKFHGRMGSVGPEAEAASLGRLEKTAASHLTMPAVSLQCHQLFGDVYRHRNRAELSRAHAVALPPPTISPVSGECRSGTSDSGRDLPRAIARRHSRCSPLTPSSWKAVGSSPATSIARIISLGTLASPGASRASVDLCALSFRATLRERPRPARLRASIADDRSTPRGPSSWCWVARPADGRSARFTGRRGHGGNSSLRKPRQASYREHAPLRFDSSKPSKNLRSMRT